MKYILLLIPFLLTGCSWNSNTRECDDRCVVKIPVYEKPKFDMPSRPELRSTIELKTDGEVVRAVELNIQDLITYARSLEELLISFK